MNYTEILQQYYLAYYGRAADQGGLDNWLALIDAEETEEGKLQVLDTIRASFGSPEQAEFVALYGAGVSDSDFFDTAYRNILNRDSDAEGKEYWLGVLATQTQAHIDAGETAEDAAAYARADVLSLLINAALAQPEGSPDRDTFANKIAIAQYITAELEGLTEEQATALLDGTKDLLADENIENVSVEDLQASVDAVVEEVTAVPGETFMLTNSATPDTIIGTSGNDTVNGPSGTVADTDLIIDQSSTDNDTANLVLKANYTPDNITKIENVNLDWDAFTTPTYALANVKGAENVTLTSSKTGFLGSATVTGADGFTLTAGAGMVGTLTASGFKTGAVEGGAATQLVVNGSATAANNESITVNAGTNTTSVTVGTGAGLGFKSATINAGTAGTVAVEDAGNTTDTTDLTVNKAAVNLTSDVAGAMTLTAGADNVVTFVAGGSVIGNGLTVKGDGNVTLVFADNDLQGETVTNSKTSGTLTIKSADTDGENLAKVSADLIEFSVAAGGAHTVASGANLKYTAAAGAINVTVGGTATTDTATVELTQNQTSVTSTGVETLNVVANATTTSGTDLTIGTLATGGNKVVLSGTNDVELTAVTGANGEVDASALNGELVVGTAASINVTGGSGKLSVTTTGAATDVSVVGNTADDTVTASVAGGSVAAILGDGKNTVTATSLDAGTLVVTGGSGIDTVTAGAALTTGVINLSLGDGANVINLDDAAGAGTRDVTTGAGDDTLTFTGGLDDANDVLKWVAGTGTDTLVLATEGADLSASKVTLDGVEVIKIKADSANDVTAEASLKAAVVSGKAFTIKADAQAAGTQIKFVGEATTSTIDLSLLSVDQTITAAVESVIVDASANTTTAQTITGTSVADIITGGAKNDTIVAGKGADTIIGGNGDDAIDITESTADQAVDNVVLNGAGNGVDTITGFKIAKDTITFGDTAEAASGGAAALATSAATVVAGAAAFDISDVDAETSDVIEIAATLSSNGNLALAKDGTELLKALSSTTTAATGLQVTDAGDNGANVFVVAYQNGNAYIYYVTAADDGLATGVDLTAAAGDIDLVGVINGVTAGALTAAEFIAL